jgi:hypothetical protein
LSQLLSLWAPEVQLLSISWAIACLSGHSYY